MTVFTEGRHTAEFLVSEGPGHISREAIIVASGADVEPGTILGRFVSGGVATSAVKASGANTGTGTFTIDATTPVLAGANLGVYTLRCIRAPAEGDIFELRDPSGESLGEFPLPSMENTIANQIKGVLVDNGTDFAVGDGFDITVTSVTEKYKKLDPAATDGSQEAAGILYGWARAADADVHAVAFIYETVIDASKVVWPAGIKPTQKATATKQLADRDIFLILP
jgi:hypothetical protein